MYVVNITRKTEKATYTLSITIDLFCLNMESCMVISGQTPHIDSGYTYINSRKFKQRPELHLIL